VLYFVRIEILFVDRWKPEASMDGGIAGHSRR
jgi:hypothetical protein